MIRDHVVRSAIAAALFACAGAAIGAAPALNDREAAYVDSIIAANVAVRTFPPVSEVLPTLSEKTAYRMQHRLVNHYLRRDRIAGFKAGMMKPEQQRGYMTAPFFGVLFQSGALAPPATIPVTKFRQIILETECGFVFGKPVGEWVPDVSTLKRYVASVRPTIEVGDKAFTPGAKLNGRDFIAANVGASHFIPGTPISPDGIDLNALEPTLQRDGQEVSRGRGSDALGDQWQALLYLVNEVVAEGYVIRPGHIIITGSMGAVYAGGPGNYLADFGPLGRIRFTVAP